MSQNLGFFETYRIFVDIQMFIYEHSLWANPLDGLAKNICSYCSSLSQHWFLSIRVQSHPPNLAFLRDTSGGPFKNVGGDRTNDTFLYLQKGVRGEVW